MNLLNSDVSQWILKYALSKSGIIVRKVVSIVIGGLAAKQIIPTGDLQQIQLGLESGLTAIVAIAYASFSAWVELKQRKGVMAGQATTHLVPGVPNAVVDGFAGNKFVTAIAKAAGVNPEDAVVAARAIRHGDKA